MLGPWDRRRAVAVAVGGATGAGVRWAVVTWAHATLFPWPVLIVNLVGSVLLGMIMAEEWSHPAARLLLHDAGGIGFCGGLTTFSTFALEIVDLARHDHAGVAVLYGLASVVGALTGVAAGAGALRRVRAVALPLEEQP